jgi:hypothetical protein
MLFRKNIYSKSFHLVKTSIKGLEIVYEIDVPCKFNKFLDKERYKRANMKMV